MTQRWKITIEYDGGDFAGWQRQDNAPTVQQAIEDAIFSFCGESVNMHVAGRTDAGVHAVGQVAHFDLARQSDAKTVRDAINFHLRPATICIVRAEPVAESFHARMSALRRIYCYKMISGRRADSIIDRNRVWNTGWDLDIDAMNKAARHLIGTHDFSSFRAAECQAKSPVKSIDRLECIENKTTIGFGRQIELWAEARSFLHHQIRNIAGTLELVGKGKWSPDHVKTVLEAKSRAAAGPMAPACGLYFVRVDYPDSALLQGVDSLL